MALGQNASRLDVEVSNATVTDTLTVRHLVADQASVVALRTGSVLTDSTIVNDLVTQHVDTDQLTVRDGAMTGYVLTAVNDEGLAAWLPAVNALEGTANQVLVSAPTGDVVLSLPQDIAPTSSPTFAQVTLTTGAQAGDVLSCSNGAGTAVWTNPTGLLVYPDLTVTLVGTSTAPLYVGALPSQTDTLTSGSVVTQTTPATCSSVFYSEALGTTNTNTTVNFSNLVQCQGPFQVFQCANLTTLGAALLTMAQSVVLQDLMALTTLSLPALRVVQGNMTVFLSALTSLNLSALAYILGTLTWTAASMPSLSLPALVSLGGLTLTSTQPSFTSVSFPSLVNLGQVLSISGAAALATVSFPALVDATHITISGTNVISTWNFAQLVTLGAFFASVSGTAQMTFPALQRAAGINISSGLTGGPVSFPSLTTVTAWTAAQAKSFAVPGGGNIVGNVGISSTPGASAPVLTTIGGTSTFGGVVTLTQLATIGSTALFTSSGVTLSLPALATVGSTFTVSNSATLTTLSLPALVSVGGTITANASLGSLTTVTLGSAGTLNVAASSTLRAINGNILMGSQSLNVASVNQILINLTTLTGAGGTTLFTGRTVTLNGGTSAAPTGNGATAKTTLQAPPFSCTINTN